MDGAGAPARSRQRDALAIVLPGSEGPENAGQERFVVVIGPADFFNRAGRAGVGSG